MSGTRLCSQESKEICERLFGKPKEQQDDLLLASSCISKCIQERLNINGTSFLRDFAPTRMTVSLEKQNWGANRLRGKSKQRTQQNEIIQRWYLRRWSKSSGYSKTPHPIASARAYTATTKKCRETKMYINPVYPTLQPKLQSADTSYMLKCQHLRNHPLVPPSAHPSPRTSSDLDPAVEAERHQDGVPVSVKPQSLSSAA